jgi:retron-type reverse transcriptase
MTPYRLFNQAFKIKKLIAAYEDHIEESTAIGLDKISRDQFRKEHLNHIKIIEKKVNNNTYKFTPYKKKLISKGEGKAPRVISIPTIRDRITLRTLCNVLTSIYGNDLKRDIPQVKISSINTNIKKHKYDSYIKIDVSNFYPSINHEALTKILKKRIRKKPLLSLIDKAITNKTVSRSSKEKENNNDRGIPQGLSISNILAEIYISEIDQKYLTNEEIFYTRYVDDILIFCKSKDVKSLFNNIEKEFNIIHLGVYPLDEEGSKCQSGDINDEIHFLGYKFKDRKSSILPNNRQRYEDSIASLLTTFKYRYNKATTSDSKNSAVGVLEWRLNLKITGCIFNKNKRGWMFYYSQIENLTELYAIDKSIAKLVERICPVKVKINIKKLIKTYHESQRLKSNSHKYIVNFDTLAVEDKRKILERYLGYGSLQSKDDDTVIKYFSMKITHIIQDLERDIGALS